MTNRKYNFGGSINMIFVGDTKFGNTITVNQPDLVRLAINISG